MGAPKTELQANCLSRIFFTWVQPLFSAASAQHKAGKALQFSDLLDLPEPDSGARARSSFQATWDRLIAGRPSADVPKKEREAAARKSIQSVLGRRFWAAGLVKALNTSLQFCFPLLLREILKFIELSQRGLIDPDASQFEKNKGYYLAGALGLAMAAKALSENAYFHMVYRAAWQARVAVTCSVYGKSLRLTAAERQTKTLGELVNLMQVDATKIEMFIPQIHVLWDGIFQITGYMTILFTLIGWPCFVGLLVMILAAPLQKKIMMKLYKLNRRMVKFTDSRVKSTNEAMQGIRCVKMYTWENSFEAVISGERRHELKFLKRAAYLRGFSRAYMGALPVLVAVASFVVYAGITDGEAEASVLFAALVAFGQLRFPLLFYPMALAQLAQARVSITRIAEYMVMSEVKGAPAAASSVPGSAKVGGGVGGGAAAGAAGAAVRGRHEHTERGGVGGGGGVVSLRGATMYWSDPSKPVPVSTMKRAARERAAAALSGDDAKPPQTTDSGDDAKPGAPIDSDGHDDEDDAMDASRAAIAPVPTEEPADSGEPPDSAGDGGETVHYPTPVLSDVSLSVEPGALFAVVGPVGSGKSSLCNAVLNEMVLAEGAVSVRGSLAYAAQSPWILNGSLRDNIVFGRPFDEKRYWRVVRACQLEHDLSLLDDGDLTAIGERGINLSGGQKQRVSVARAAYADCDVTVLDDPLSALDPEVGQKLFDECIVGLMKGKTRLLVTNQLQCLSSCDRIAVVGDGAIQEQGSYAELTSASAGGRFRALMKDFSADAGRKPGDDGDVEAKKNAGRSRSLSAPGSPRRPAGKSSDSSEAGAPKALIEKEERNVGAVEWTVYKRYIRSGGGYCLFAVIYFVFVLCTLLGVVSTAWITLWTQDPLHEDRSLFFYLAGYAVVGILLGVVTFLRSLLLAIFGVKASAALHGSLLRSVLAAPMSFFDTTPTGRILSRFSKDIHSIDEDLSNYLDFFLFCTLFVVSSLATITYVTPPFGIAVLPIGIVYVRVLNYFREVAREAKRLDSISRSPVFAHFSETLGGLSTIRAYGQSGRFVDDFLDKLDRNTRAYYCMKSADRWLSVRLELLGAFIGLLAAMFASFSVIGGSEDGDDFSSLAGLSLTYAIQVTGLLNWCVRSFAQLEAAMNSCERVVHYVDNIPHEAPATSAGLARLAAQRDRGGRDADAGEEAGASLRSFLASGGGEAHAPPEGWPSRGGIEIDGLRMRYREGTPMVLRGIRCVIRGGERVGVVGRTGSGKSSLLLCLMRIVEPDLGAGPDGSNQERAYAPPIRIDGVDTMRIGLRELRSKLGIIPQNPVLFSGSVRSNLDPFGEHEDAELWEALDKCSMRAAVEAMPEKLGAPVSEYGENISQGQRQLLCLGRALLKRCRVLLLDEATSSVDFETDKAIQETLRTSFAGCTVLTIAHRVNTIMDSDKILVLKDGQVAEFDEPATLLADKGSLFSDIARHAKADA
jgi:ABC-type multidrug transport system fused ATPase/permease subunit